MAWYRSEAGRPQGARMAVVNAVGVSVFFAVYFVGFSRLSPLFKRPWLSLAIGVAFAVIAWGIRRMSRAAAIAGLVLCLGWVILHMPSLLYAVYRYGNGMALFWVIVDIVFLSFYLIAVRATGAYHNLSAPASPARMKTTSSQRPTSPLHSRPDR